MKKFLKKILNKLFFYYYEKDIFIKGIILSNINKRKKLINNLSCVEFSAFSQWGEDGIIDWLIGQFKYIPKTFIEFGVGDYLESNTRFLIKKRNWKGLILESNKEDVLKIKSDPIYWKQDLIVKNIFIKKNNINEIIKKNLKNLEVGLLSVDIDGNDYWIIEHIKCVKPYIIVCEYNAILGDKKKLTVPYNEKFNRTSEHYSNLFFGASINALRDLMNKKGYSFIGTNSSGANAYFIRNNYAKRVLKKIRNIESFPSKFRESRNNKGQKNFIRWVDRINIIKNKKILNLNNKKILPLSKIKNIYSSEWKKEIN